MAKHLCKNCNEYVARGNHKDYKCPKCDEHLVYIGSCGECLNFEEFYDGIGTCDYKKHTRFDSEGCKNFK